MRLVIVIHWFPIVHVLSETRSNSLQLGDVVGKFLDCINLLLKVMSLQEIAQLTKKRIRDHRQWRWNLPEDHFDLHWFDEGWGGLHWLLSPVSMLLPLPPGEFPIHPVMASTQNIICQWCQVVHLLPYLNVHENNSTSSRVLIVNESLGMFSFLKRSFLEVLVKSRKGNIVTIEKGCHRQVHIRGVQFKIDLFVDGSLTISMEVLPSLRCRHSVHLLVFLVTDNNCVLS